MSSPRPDFPRILLRASVPLVCSILAGMIFYGGDVFATAHPAFQFVWSALVGSVFYNLLLTVKRRDAMLGLIVLLLLTFLTTGSTEAAYVLRDIFYVAAIGVSVLAYVIYFRPLAGSHRYVAPVALAGLYGILNVIAGGSLLVVSRSISFRAMAFGSVSVTSIMAFWGVVIGCSVGIGIDLAERLFPLQVPPESPAGAAAPAKEAQG